MDTDDFFEHFWDALLSCDPERIRAVYLSLDEANQALVIRHLRRMVGEAGWHAEQKKSARAALKAIKDRS